MSLYLFNLYAEYIEQNVRLDEAQVGIKIAGRNINNLRYADDTMAEGEEELKSLLMKVKEQREKVGLPGGVGGGTFWSPAPGVLSEPHPPSFSFILLL